MSILKDFTLEMCVPSFRCIVAQRMHRNIPKLQLAQAGLRVPQSAHVEFPGTLSRSCNSLSVRACALLLMVAMTVNVLFQKPGEAKLRFEGQDEVVDSN